MTSEQLQAYKNVYTDIRIPEHIVDEKWQVVQHVLPEQNLKPPYYRFMQYGAVFLSVCILIVVAIVAIAQTATPGGFLYSVKALSKNISTNFVNSFKPVVKTSQIKVHIVTRTSTTTPSVPTPSGKPEPTTTEKHEVQGISTQSFEHSENASNQNETHDWVVTSNTVTQMTPGNKGNGNSENSANSENNKGDSKQNNNEDIHNANGDNGSNDHNDTKNGKKGH